MIIDARFDGFSIAAGAHPPEEVLDRRRALAKLFHEAEGKYFPDGIRRMPSYEGRQRPRRRFFLLARIEA